MVTFVPVEMTNGRDTVTATTPGQFNQYAWDGYWEVGTAPQAPPQFEAFIPRVGATSGQVPVLQANGMLAFGTVGGAGGAIPDADGSTKGVLQLNGDLSGTADQPTVISGVHHSHSAVQILDSSSVGRAVLTAADAAAARTAIGAGTSSLALGATGTTAAAGNHTHTSAGITDLVEAVQDIVGAFVVAGTGCTVSYDDAANTFTINVTGGGGGGTVDAEGVRDTIGSALVAGAGIQITVNDAADTITVASTAVLPTRQVVAGTGLTGGGDLSADRTLAVAFGTTATTVAAGNHTHQAATGISDWVTAFGAALSTQLISGDNINLTYDSGANTVTIDTATPAVSWSSLPANIGGFLIKPPGGSWPAARPTSRSDIAFGWIGTDPPPSLVNSGTGGMLNNVDFMLVTSS